MPRTALKNILTFTGLVIGVPVSQPHFLMFGNIAKIPQFLVPSAGGFTITADATNVTVTRTVDAVNGNVNVLAWRWHTYEDAEPAGNIATSLFPFVVPVGVGGGGGTGGVGIAAGTELATSGNITFANSNGVSFGLNTNSVLTASIDAINTVSAGSTFATGPAVVFGNSNGVSFGVNGNTVTASVSQTLQPAINFAAGTQTATSGTVAFSNSNGVSMGLSGSSQLTASFQAIRNISAGTTFASATQVVFSNANGVSFGANGGTITASVAAGAALALSAGASSQSAGTIQFNNGNGVSFGLNAGTMTASVAAGGGGGIAASAGTQSVSTGTVAWANSNGISFGMSDSNAITASFDGIRNISAGTTNAAGSQIVFGNANGMSFGANGSTITGAFDAIKGVIAGTQTQTSGSAFFINGASGISFVGTNGSQIFGIQAANYGVSNLGNTAGSTGTVRAQYIFAGVGGITLSQSTAGGGGATLSISGGQNNVRQFQDPAQFGDANAASFGALSLYRQSFGAYATVTQFRNMLQFSYDTIGVTETITVSFGAYTFAASTASLASSHSQTFTIAQGVLFGTSPAMFVATGATFNFTPGDYLIAQHIRWNTTNINSDSGSFYGARTGSAGIGFSRMFGGDATVSQQWVNGYSNASFSTAMPASINLTNANYVRTGASAGAQPSFQFLGT